MIYGRKIEPRRIGYIWECGDDYCSCTEAVVIDEVTGYEWRGTFYTDGEGWPHDEAELRAHREHLRATNPELESAIRWIVTVDNPTEDKP